MYVRGKKIKEQIDKNTDLNKLTEPPVVHLKIQMSLSMQQQLHDVWPSTER